MGIVCKFVESRYLGEDKLMQSSESKLKRKTENGRWEDPDGCPAFLCFCHASGFKTKEIKTAF